MKNLLTFLASTSLWFVLGAFCGSYLTYHQGYARGVRDIGMMMLELHDAAIQSPEPQAKRHISWGRP